ncbi:Signal recognition particle subunit SRP68 [Hypsizygus marmoreus]|uniref:Signal recognition particle subunit SRP68 n=1 Tax=Hypsizygus marmoreus TaxID=39966 RepID=A0A369K886_HYPMA|nr:Signal recognition particle subunit SRP68 [Hypsizygus marmoreus]
MPEENTKPGVVFRALQLANEQRTAYGLRYNDFPRYRKHCANRTHRLRSTLKMTHGKGREFKKLPPLSSDIIKDGHLQLLLLEAERAWAYSQELSSLALKPNNADQASTLRHSATGRFRRAVHWSTQLLSHCQTLHAAGRLSASNLIEATVYTLILNGRFLRYRSEFDDALIQLGVARSLLDELAGAAGTSRDQALAVLFADDVGPEIRYCAHEMGRERAYDVDRIVGEVAGRWRGEIVPGWEGLVEGLRREVGKEGEGRRRLREVSWEGKPVPVRNPELVDVLLKVQEAEARLEGGEGVKGKAGKESKKGVAAYDAILSALSDAEQVARKLMEAQQLSGTTSSGASGAGGGRDMHFVHAYILYQLLSRRIQRDLQLINALLSTTPSKNAKKPAETGSKPKLETVDGRLYPAVLKLLDTVLQSLDQMRTLSIVDDSPDLAAAVEARTSFIKAKRCLYLARSYAPIKRYAESLTLTQHAHIHIRETYSSLGMASSDPISLSTPSFFPLADTDCKDLEAALAQDGLRFKMDWFAWNGGRVGAEQENGKKFEKPLFFDVALNYVELDMEGLLARAGKKPVPVVGERKAAVPVQVVPLEKKPSGRAKVEEDRAGTPEPEVQAAPARGGLSSLLGGWWGKS